MDGNHPRQSHPRHPTHHRTDTEDDLMAASKGVDEAVDYKQYMPKLKPERKFLRRLVKTVVLLVVIAGCGMGAYVFGAHYNTSKTASSIKATTASSTTKVTPPTQIFTSNYQDLTFVYPTDWKVQETSTVITATSPVLKLTSYARQIVTGHIIFQVRAQDVALNEFSAGAATAALNSQIINYAAPASGQRASTYISFLNYANSKGGGIDGIYITGNAGYQSGQDAPESDVQSVSPVVSFTFSKCTNKVCSGTTTPLTIASQNWSEKAFSGPLLAMFESLAIS
jgi:hypothetical protein